MSPKSITNHNLHHFEGFEKGGVQEIIERKRPHDRAQHVLPCISYEHFDGYTDLMIVITKRNYRWFPKEMCSNDRANRCCLFFCHIPFSASLGISSLLYDKRSDLIRAILMIIRKIFAFMPPENMELSAWLKSRYYSDTLLWQNSIFIFTNRCPFNPSQ